MLGAMAVDAVGSGMYIPFSLVFFHHITGLSFAVVGAVLTAVGLVGMAALPLAGAAVDRYGARRVQLVLYGVRGTGFAPCPLASALPAFAAVALGTAFGDRAFPAVQQSWIGEVAAGADRDRLQAAARALRNAGLGAGALLASLVVALAGDRGFVAAACLNAASFGVAWLLMRRCRHPRARPRSRRPYRGRPATGWSSPTAPSSPNRCQLPHRPGLFGAPGALPALHRGLAARRPVADRRRLHRQHGAVRGGRGPCRPADPPPQCPPHPGGGAGRGDPASGNTGTAVGAENDLVQGVRVLTRFSYSWRALRWAGTAGRSWLPSSGWQWARSPGIRRGWL